MSKFVVDELPDSCGACPCFSSKDGGCPFGDNFGSCFDRFVILVECANYGARSGWHKAVNKVIEAWNQRYEPPTPGGIIVPFGNARFNK